VRTRRLYRGFISDSSRWDGFELRTGDIVVTTPPKCGTTWMQMCCLLLVHQTPDLPAPLGILAPWLDQTLAPVEEIHARLGAQEHRRVIKTHTPLDGIPVDERATYIGVGRDPRDVALSMANHSSNMDMDAAQRARVADFEPPPRGEAPPDLEGQLRQWMDADGPVEAFGSTLKFTAHHLSTLWAHLDAPNVALFHYSDMKADLDGEMRRLAAQLGIVVDEARWPELVAAAQFAAMKDRADRLAPNADKALWHDNGRFFAEGRLGGWRDVMPPDVLARYDQRLAELVPADLAAWMHDGGRVLR
jgi:aryl sulfotransferase